MRKSKPAMFVFAGPNGSGKSTIIDFFLENNFCPKDYICPDQLVPADKKDDEEEYKKAMIEAERRRISRVENKSSFTFETVLSMREKLDFIKFAKSEGYFITVLYVITSDSKINIERVKNRVSSKGHGVPLDKIVSRYERSMDLMFEVFFEAHEAIIYDNSGEKPIVILAKYIDGRLFTLRPFPDWVRNRCADKEFLQYL